MKTRSYALFFVAIATSLLGLGGCASTRLVDSEVQSFSKISTISAPATYRFERLPSQQSYGEGQAKLEKLVQDALAKTGLTRLADGPGELRVPAYSVQIGVRTQREPRAPWEDSTPGALMLGRDFVVAANGQVVMALPMPRADLPWYQREVSLLIRDAASNQVVYETHAVHGGRWADGSTVLPAMFSAALSGFPNPPAGQRKINVEVITQ